MHQHSNSVELLSHLLPERIAELEHLQELLKRKYKKYKVKSWKEWTALDRSVRLEHLRELSFANLETAATLFDDVYGSGCFDLAWGEDEHRRLAQQYSDYQTLRNGILHRGGEFSSGSRIEATEGDISTTFEDTKRFRDAILRLSDWCRAWWISRCRTSFVRRVRCWSGTHCRRSHEDYASDFIKPYRETTRILDFNL